MAPEESAQQAPKPGEPDPVLTIDEVAAILKIPVSSCHEKKSEIGFFRVGKHVRVRRSTLDAYMRRQEAAAKGEAA